MYEDDNYGEKENKELVDSVPTEEKGVKEKHKKSFRGSILSYIALALIASMIGGLVSSYIVPKIYGNILPESNQKQYTSQPVSISTNDDINTVSAVVKKSMSSVVGITTLETKQSIFEERDVEGLGSGLIVNSDGYILTNSHVVADGKAKELTVLFDNGDKVPGEVLWNDSMLDLAIVKVDVTNLPEATLGDSEDLQVGEIAIAIGNPLGLEFQRTVTSGIISGLNRSVQLDQTTVIEDLIQTDASINPGNSGGPLLNSAGEVIGINTAKIQSGEALGFAIPINVSKEIIEEVISEGSYERAELGIAGRDIEEYQAILGLDLGLDKGVIILQISEDTPAQRSGLKNNDIITKIDNEEVDSIQGLKKSLYKYKKGDKAKLTIIRDSKEKQIDVTF